MKSTGQMTQVEMIARHLEDNGSITAAEAMGEYGIFRLAARISDLKKLGYPIDSETVSGENRYGDTVHFKKYFLEA